jgi:hypothetical protein
MADAKEREKANKKTAGEENWAKKEKKS